MISTASFSFYMKWLWCWELIKLRKENNVSQHMASGLQLAVNCDRFILQIPNETIFGWFGQILRMNGHKVVGVASLVIKCCQLTSGWTGIGAAQCSHTPITAHFQYHPPTQIHNNLSFKMKVSKQVFANQQVTSQWLHLTTKTMLTTC